MKRNNFSFMMVFVLLMNFVLMSDGMAKVRNLVLSEKTMGNVVLKMGNSTILRFREKPQKVVVGNKNYFNIEFIDHDITIQPLGIVTTNLFVYGEYHTYGVVLNVTHDVQYDDLVTIEWAPMNFAEKEDSLTTSSSSSQTMMDRGIDFKLGQLFDVKIKRIFRHPSLNLTIIDMVVLYKGSQVEDTKNLKMFVGDGSKKKFVEKQATIFEKDRFLPREKILARMFFRSNEKIDLEIFARYRDVQNKVLLGRNLL